MSKKEIQKLKDTLWANAWSNEEIIDEGIATLKKSMEYKEEGFRRIESAGLLAIYTLQQKNKALKEQLDISETNYEIIYGYFTQIKELLDEETCEGMLEKINYLQNQLKQRDEAIEDAIKYIKENTKLEHDGDEYGYTEWIDIKEQNIVFINSLLSKLQKYKGDNK